MTAGHFVVVTHRDPKVNDIRRSVCHHPVVTVRVDGAPNEVFCTGALDAAAGTTAVPAAGRRHDGPLRGMGARRSVRFQLHDKGGERAFDMSDAVNAKLPDRERRGPVVWRPGSELAPLEEEMVACAAAGELVDCGGGPFSLAAMQAWGPERTVRAAVLRHC